MRRVSLAMAAGFCALWLAPAATALDSGSPPPELDRARAGPCIEDPAVMRRSHMEILLNAREAAVRLGERRDRVSLAACVDCHANRADNRVLGSDTHFCQGCHRYAAVKIDCFECHSSRARPAKLAGGSTPRPTP